MELYTSQFVDTNQPDLLHQEKDDSFFTCLYSSILEVPEVLWEFLTVTVLSTNSELGVDVCFFSRIWFTLEEKSEKYLCTWWITERALYSISSLTLLHFAPGVGSRTTEREKAM